MKGYARVMLPLGLASPVSRRGEQENHQRYRVRVVRLVIAELAAWQAALWRHDDWKARRGAAKAEITVAQHHTVEDILAGGKQ
ncbi:hypothetical protein GCM10008955_00850 [Deinococcus malanensis]|uniref:Uncharacterized protein n=2 Tax=Deinococcus malanensis TaxID=1706855 RepID=A0ABQ2EKU3_9DEIO|nr:hypothetical protein GCM10008955_00850 [Deinococcus malanensis]